MNRLFSLCLFALLALAVAAPASAQKIEITPFVGYQFGGELAEIGDETVNRKIEQSPAWGLMLDFSVTANDQVEIFYSNQSTELNRGTEPAFDAKVEFFQVGALHTYAPNKPVNPYVGLTLGATRYGVLDGSDTRFSGSIALGLKMLVSDHAGFRFDGRIFGTSTGSGTIGCSDETCIGYPDTSIIWNYSVNAGLIIHFGR
jgi:hypothetical protein